jgi:hypothetical protein
MELSASSLFMNRSTLPGITLFILVLSFTASAQGGPPMITDDTGTVPEGHFEINTAFTV